MKFLTTQAIIGLQGKGLKTLAGVLVELDPKNEQHAALIKAGAVVEYVEPKQPAEVKLGK